MTQIRAWSTFHMITTHWHCTFESVIFWQSHWNRIQTSAARKKADFGRMKNKKGKEREKRVLVFGLGLENWEDEGKSETEYACMHVCMYICMYELRYGSLYDPHWPAAGQAGMTCLIWVSKVKLFFSLGSNQTCFSSQVMAAFWHLLLPSCLPVYLFIISGECISWNLVHCLYFCHTGHEKV